MKFNYQNQEFELSVSHSASSYGIPVLVYKGEAYGKNDFPPLGGDFSLFDSALIVSHAFPDLESRPPEVCKFLGW